MIIQEPDGRLHYIPLHEVSEYQALLGTLRRCIRAWWHWSASRVASLRVEAELYPAAVLKFMP